MTNVIYKYPIDLQQLSRSKASLVLPPGAMILTAAFQGRNLCVWAVVDKDDNTPNPERRLAVYGTGQEFDEHPGRYVATAFYDMHGPSPLVFHVFEQTDLGSERARWEQWKAEIDATMDKLGISVNPLIEQERREQLAPWTERQRREGLAGRLDPEGRRHAAEREARRQECDHEWVETGDGMECCVNLGCSAERPKGDYGSEYDDV